MIKNVFLTLFQKFIKIESFNGIFLMSAIVVALVWANSLFGNVSEEIWQYDIGIVTESFEIKRHSIL